MATENRPHGNAHKGSGRQAESIEEYWTEERRAKAKPVPMPKRPAGTHPLKEQGELAKGPAGRTAGHHGSEEEPKAGVAPRSGGQAVGNPLNYPWRTVGKLFFTRAGGDWVGSASLIQPNILLTAGHCVFEGGEWSGNVMFYPSYGSRKSNDPMYRFGYSYEACWTAWSDDGNSAYDYGMIWIDAGPGNTVGWLGTLWNADTSGRSWTAVGYPEDPNPPFSGGTMESATGQYVSGPESGVIGLSNDNMEQGSSGGPWITTWNESSPTHANGVQSFHQEVGYTEYGPYFTQDLNGLMNWITNPTNRK